MSRTQGPLRAGLAAGVVALVALGCDETSETETTPAPASVSAAPDAPDAPSAAVAELDARLAAIDAEARRASDAAAPDAGAPDAAASEPDAAAEPSPQKAKTTKKTQKEIAEDNALRKRPRAFTAADLDTKELTALLAAHPRTKRLAKDVSYYWDPQAGIRVLGRGTNDPKGFEFEALPKIWNPDDGTGIKFLLIMGRSGEDTSFIVVYRMSDEKKATLASSFIMENEVGPLAFGFSQAVRRRVYFTSCWGCPGESGKVLLKDDGRVVIVQP